MTRRKSSAKPPADAKRRVQVAASPSSEVQAGHTASNGGRRLIVGIGASAGGLQAFKAFFAQMPADSGMAFVLVQHLDPEHRSMLAELLSSATSMPVVGATNGMTPEADHVYVIPPNATLRIADGKLRVSKPAPAREHRHPVDTFFSSLAEDQGENAVCIVLSGGGSDGTKGLQDIKEHGGLTMAQAAFDEHAMSGMPVSAAATGLVDHVLAVEDMPAKLVEYNKHLLAIEPHKGPDGTRSDATGEPLTKLFALLRRAIGHDFSQYKEKTLVRRIQRRMQVLQIDTVPAYVDCLRKDTRETQLLFRELLIGVTQFFRDPAAFPALETKVIRHIVHKTGADVPIRVWVPACATGEEVYSIAILLKEAARNRDAELRFQIFGTDIDENAIAVARAARYEKAQIADISAERLDRWFVADGNHWCPVKEIREMCIFSPHSVVKDPPFSRLDLISCRNLLIYFDTALQERLIHTFHYVLRPGGYLFLGTAESVTRYPKLFVAVDQKHRIFERHGAPASLPSFSPRSEPVPLSADRTGALSGNSIEESARRAMEKHAPAYVVVNANHEVVRFSGATEKYLGPTPGAASLDLFSLIRRGLRTAARAALTEVAGTRGPAVQEALVIDVNGIRQLVDLHVESILEGEASLFVVAFIDRRPEAGNNGGPDARKTSTVKALEKELRTTRERLEATIEQLETSNEELKSANEEYQSINEEFQSTNEELETSKEEMQSINEELQTINAELNSKNETLMRLNSDFKNLLDSTQIATLFLDRQLRIKNFTPSMTEVFHLRDGDRGRPVTEIATRLSYDGLRTDAVRVLRDLSVVEREVHVPDDDSWFLMRLRPYRTVDDVIDGVVITFIDIAERKRHEEARARLAAIVESSQDAIIGHSFDGTITSWNAGATEIFGYTADEVFGKPLAILLPDSWIDEIPHILKRLKHGERVQHFEIERRTRDGNAIDISMTISPVKSATGAIIAASTIAHDTTQRRRNEAERARLAAIVESSDEAIISEDVDGIIVSWNRGAERLFGYAGEEVVGTPVAMLAPPDRRDEAPNILARIKLGERIDNFETVRHRKDGSRVELSLTVSPIRSPAGEVVGAAKIVRDITERKRAELHQRLLINELNHRVKNTLATVQAVASQSLRNADSMTQAREVLETRLMALAKAHDMLTREKWEGADLVEVVSDATAAYSNSGEARFSVQGPAVRVSPRAALSLAMALHELVTNAVKYGALSTADGRVDIAWSVNGDAEDSRLALTWAENGGPPVAGAEATGVWIATYRARIGARSRRRCRLRQGRGDLHDRCSPQACGGVRSSYRRSSNLDGTAAGGAGSSLGVLSCCMTR